MPKSLLGSPSETMENNGNIALGVGVILLLLNVGVGVSGVLDGVIEGNVETCLLYTSPSPRDKRQSRMPSSA